MIKIQQLKSLVSDLTRDNNLLKETNDSLDSQVQHLSSEVQRLNNQVESLRVSGNISQVEEKHHSEENNHNE